MGMVYLIKTFFETLACQTKPWRSLVEAGGVEPLDPLGKSISCKALHQNCTKLDYKTLLSEGKKDGEKTN
jgi:hypothetical protein